MTYGIFAFAAFLYWARWPYLALGVSTLAALVALGLLDPAMFTTPGYWDRILTRPGEVEPTITAASALLAVFWLGLND